MAVRPREAYTADEERWIRYGSAPLLATLLLPIIIGVILVLKCVFNHCCVRRTTTKEEMYGLEGRMTMLSTADSSFVTLSDNRHDSHTTSVPVAIEVGAKAKDVSHNLKSFSAEVPLRSEFGKGIAVPGPSSSASKVDSAELPQCSSSYEDTRHANIESRRISDTSKLTSSQGSAELSGSLKRANAQHRQLPDLPPTPIMALGTGARPPRRSSSVLSHDGTSELYATVGETPFPEDSSKASSHYTQIRDKSGMLKSPNNNSIVDPGLLNVAGSSTGGISGRARGIEATPSSDSETYASSSSHHPYAKLKKNTASAEHPYARVRAMGASNNDEETDTDNYDLPQFLRGEGGAPPPAPVPNTSSSVTNRPTSSGVSPSEQHPSASSAVGSGDISGPVPPRRVGRQWRRSSQPNMQNDNVSNFSGDSQDSRGYTSISVREPLSNIRNQLVANTRSFDSHYASVSDDSEEMYAAIDDPNDANYMRIPGDQEGQPRRPTWLGGPSVSSPIPERREANSPLPPVPPVPPGPNVPLPEPTQSSTTPPIPAPNSPNSSIKNSALPVYAQVTKKPKKQQPQAKLPVTPTVSNVSTSSSQQIGWEPTVAAISSGDTVVMKENPITSHHHPTHRSKRAASLMDNTNPMDADTVDSRRWSKADISYSEFEVIRESIFPSSSGAPGNNPRSPGPSSSRDPPPAIPSSPPTSARQQELLDEDNYNIIPDKTARGGSSAPTAVARNRLDSGNYQIIEHGNLGGAFREVEDPTGHSDHYQEINDRRRLPVEDDESGQLYQEIERPARNLDEDDDEDDDDGDEFYERVKKPPSSAKGKKHGYEKIKKKNIPGNLSGVVPAYVSDDDDEDDDRPDELYERVKYPPYERLKESKDDLYDSEDGKSKSDYEDIGYSRVKPKQKVKNPKEQQSRPPEKAGQTSGRDGTSSSAVHANVEDVSQLYAQVDKSKKRKGASTCPMPSPKTHNSNTEVTNCSDNTVHHEIYVNNNEPTSKSSHCTSDPMDGHEHLYSKVAKVNKADKAKNKNSGSASEREQSCIVNDRNIEYL